MYETHHLGKVGGRVEGAAEGADLSDGHGADELPQKREGGAREIESAAKGDSPRLDRWGMSQGGGGCPGEKGEGIMTVERKECFRGERRAEWRGGEGKRVRGGKAGRGRGGWEGGEMGGGEGIGAHRTPTAAVRVGQVGSDLGKRGERA